jgi:hypothetical protein
MFTGDGLIRGAGVPAFDPAAVALGGLGYCSLCGGRLELITAQVNGEPSPSLECSRCEQHHSPWQGHPLEGQVKVLTERGPGGKFRRLPEASPLPRGPGAEAATFAPGWLT